jgi:hypothetical protein
MKGGSEPGQINTARACLVIITGAGLPVPEKSSGSRDTDEGSPEFEPHEGHEAKEGLRFPISSAWERLQLFQS